jgi:hypothetical protein
MPIFDQRYQNVTYQYNAAGNIAFGDVTNGAQLVQQLRNLRDEVALAKGNQAVDEETATDIDYHLNKASLAAASEKPNKTSVLDHLAKAKGFLEKAGPLAAGILGGVSEAIKLVSRLLG